MATWGYRVYTFELLSGRDAVLAQELPEHRELLWEAMERVGLQTRVGKPHFRESENAVDDEDVSTDYQDTEPTLSIRGTAYDSSNGVLHASAALGERGLHDYAVDPENGEDRVAVDTRSAETPRRVDFFFATAQFQGFLVAEVVGMKDPIPLLVPWIRKLSIEHRKAAMEAIDSRSEHFNKAGDKITKSKAKELIPKAVRLRVERVADPELLKQVLGDIQSMETEFIEMDANNRESNKRLIVKVRDKKTQQSIVKRLANPSPDKTDKIIKQTLNDLDVDDASLTTANIAPDSVKARIRSKEGNTTLVPGKISELFNYSFKNSGCPSNAPYYETVVSKLEHLKSPAQVAISIPDVDNMVGWIEDEEASWEPLIDPSQG